MDESASARRFRGKVCVVTGAGGGIGRAISVRLAAEGGYVIACDIDARAAEHIVQVITEQGGHADAVPFDLGDVLACRDAIAAVAGAHGRIDVLVNNAGINRRGDLLSLTEKDWETSFTINVHALFHLCRAALPHMMERGGGAIVNTASQWGLHPAPGHIAYNVTKAAVVSFTQNLARDYAEHNIRVNAVAPGEIRTPMLEAGLAVTGRTVTDLEALVPFGRIGRPDEVAAVVAFLASSEAEFVCGSVVEITGAQAVA